MGILLGLAILYIIAKLITLVKEKESSEPKSTPLEIQKTRTLNDMITSINYGMVYPYYIGMSFDEVKDSMLLFYTLAEATKFKEKYSNPIACIQPLVSLPTQNPYIDDIILDINKNKVVDSITIVIKDFSENATQIKELMCTKFGEHTPTNGRHIAWRNMRMIIRVDEIDGLIEVVYIKI